MAKPHPLEEQFVKLLVEGGRFVITLKSAVHIHEARGAAKERARIRKAQTYARKRVATVLARGILDAGAVHLLTAAGCDLDDTTKPDVAP